jgi:hypothetical protein
MRLSGRQTFHQPTRPHSVQNGLSGVFALVVLVDVIAYLVICTLTRDAYLRPDPAFFKSIVGRPELSNVIEPRDRFIAVLVILQPLLVIGASLALKRCPNVLRSRLRFAIHCALVVSSVFAIVLLSRWRDTRPLFSAWPGFNSGRFLWISVLLLLLMSWANRNRRVRQALILTTSSIGFLLTLTYMPYLVHKSSSVIDPYHSRFIIDELLAASAGSLPLVEYTAQYTNLLGYFIVPLARLYPKGAIGIVTTYVSVLQLLCVGIVFFTFKKFLGFVWAIGGLALLLCVTLAAPDNAPLTNTVVGYWAVMPIRLFGPMILMVSVAVSLKRSPILIPPIGVLSALVVLNNVEWGLPAALAAGLCIGLNSPEARVARQTFTSFAIWFGATVCLVFGLLIVGGGVEPSRLTSFIQIFGGSGYFAVPSLGWGIHLIVVATFVCCLIVGVSLSPMIRMIDLPAIPAALHTYCGVFGLGAYLYFLNRSLIAVLTSLFFLWGLALILLFHAGWVTSRRFQNYSVFSHLLPLILLFSLALSVFQPPSPTDSLRRISDSIGANFEEVRGVPARAKRIADVVRLTRGASDEVGLVGTDSSLLALLTGTRNVTNFNGIDSVITFQQASMICESIAHSGLKTILITDEISTPELSKELERCRTRTKSLGIEFRYLTP